MIDYSKEIINIANVILYRKGWYLHTGTDKKSVMKDLKEMLGYDGYPKSHLDENDIYRIIFTAYDNFCKYAWVYKVPGFEYPLSSITTGTYHNIGKENDFKFNLLLEILAKFAFIESKYLKLPAPKYGKHRYKIGHYKPGMTYAYMNKYAKEIFEK